MRTLTTLFIFCNIQLGFSQSVETILLKTEERVNSLNCVSYKSIHSSSSPGDTIVYYRNTYYFDVTTDPDDIVFGSRFVASFKDSTKMDLDYHSSLEIRYNWDKKTLRIDTINPKSPFIALRAPIPYQLKALVQYSLAHKDSVECSSQAYADTIRLNFILRKRLAVFHNLKPYIFPSDTMVSIYTVWLNKDYLPFRMKSRTSQTIVDELTYQSINNCDSLSPRRVGVIMPEGFALETRTGKRISPVELEGKQAASWTLESVNGDSARLVDFKGKVLLVEFTGAGCGPCEQAISFLKDLTARSGGKNFQVLSIETWETHRLPLKRFKDSHNLNYEYLIADDATKNRYMVSGVPMFVIIDRNNIIRKVLVGYGKGSTDQDISTLLKQIL